MEERGMYVVNKYTRSWMGDRKRRPSNLDLCFADEEVEGRIIIKQEKDI